MVDMFRPRSAGPAVRRAARSLGTPAGVVRAWRRRSARATVSALLAQLATPPTAESVQTVLRAVFNDPSAAVLYRLPGDPEFVSAAGEPASAATLATVSRLMVEIPGQHDEIVGLLSLDARCNVDMDRVRAALIACRPALENARLQAILRSHLRAARQSRTRIVQTAVTERRRLARDLHDGAQQHLHALSASLVIARQRASPQSHDAIDTAREQLRNALATLRGLGRNLYPAVLDAEGLTAALESLADDAPLELDIDGTIGRFDPETEIIVYLTVREIVDGLAADGAATQATVTVAAADGRLSLRVASDGRLGREYRNADWRSVVTDRIHAVGGEMTIESDPELSAAQGGIGICAEAWIPCE